MQRNNPCHACQNILSLLSKILLEPPHKHQQQLKEDTFAPHTHRQQTYTPDISDSFSKQQIKKKLAPMHKWTQNRIFFQIN